MAIAVAARGPVQEKSGEEDHCDDENSSGDYSDPRQRPVQGRAVTLADGVLLGTACGR
jgi:hypothetical protein